MSSFPSIHSSNARHSRSPDNLTPLPGVLHVRIAACLLCCEVINIRSVHRVLAAASHNPLAYVRSVCWTPQSVDELRSVLQLCETAIDAAATLDSNADTSTDTDTDTDSVVAAAASSLNPSWLWPAASIRFDASARSVLAQLGRLSLDSCYGLHDSDLTTALSLCTSLTELSIGAVAAQYLTSKLNWVGVSPTHLRTLSLGDPILVTALPQRPSDKPSPALIADIAAFTPNLEVCEVRSDSQDDSLQLLGRLPSLRVLLTRGQLPSDFLSPEHFPSLTELDLDGTPSSDELLPLCSRLPLRRLTVSDCLDGPNAAILEPALTALLSASSACHSTLESLRLVEIASISLTPLFLLASRLPRLKSLWVGGDDTASENGTAGSSAASELLAAIRTFLSLQSHSLEALELPPQVNAAADELLRMLSFECPALRRLSAYVSIANESPFSTRGMPNASSSDHHPSQLKSLELLRSYSDTASARLCVHDLLHPLFSSLEELTVSAHRLFDPNTISSPSSSAHLLQQPQPVTLPRLHTLRLLSCPKNRAFSSLTAAEVQLWASVAPNVSRLVLEAFDDAAPDPFAAAAVCGFNSLTALSLMRFCFGADSSEFWQAVLSSPTLLDLSITRPHHHAQLEPATVESALLKVQGSLPCPRLLFLTVELPVHSPPYRYNYDKYSFDDALAIEYGRWHHVRQQIWRTRPNLRFDLTCDM